MLLAELLLLRRRTVSLRERAWRRLRGGTRGLLNVPGSRPTVSGCRVQLGGAWRLLEAKEEDVSVVDMVEDLVKRGMRVLSREGRDPRWASCVPRVGGCGGCGWG